MMSNESAPTLGQRIDAMLQPLYAEAEQHRATIAEVTEQQQALQQKVDAATQGLGQIESRMAEVVRAMAGQEPVIAAVVGNDKQASVIDAVVEPLEQVAPIPVSEAESAQVQPKVLEPKPAESEVISEPEQVAEAEPVADVALAEVTSEEEEAPAIELDPAADAAAVGEAAALLDAVPVEAEPKPKVDLAAAAERAAAAAKLLREKAASK